jgi:hypothetical protein
LVQNDLRKAFFCSRLALAVSLAILTVVPSLQGQTLDSSDDIPQLMQTLSFAYGNSERHDTPDANLSTEDLSLQTAAIQFSLEMLSGIGQTGCTLSGTKKSDSKDLDADGGRCLLKGTFERLPDLAASLSYAAYRLENLEVSYAAGHSDTEQSPALAHLGAMEHLYRTVFALSSMYLDSLQSPAYLQSAHEQLQFARSHMEREETLCGCTPQGYPALLLQLSQLNDEINALRSSALP